MSVFLRERTAVMQPSIESLTSIMADIYDGQGSNYVQTVNDFECIVGVDRLKR